jgi:hypothetical protein
MTAPHRDAATAQQIETATDCSAAARPSQASGPNRGRRASQLDLFKEPKLSMRQLHAIERALRTGVEYSARGVLLFDVASNGEALTEQDLCLIDGSGRHVRTTTPRCSPCQCAT